MDIFSYFDEMQRDLFEMDLPTIEHKYFDLCSQLAGIDEAERIQSFDLNEYIEESKEGLSKSLLLANEFTQAIYFEYDLDNNWSSTFFLCDEYNRLEDQNDNWACEWIDYVVGSSLTEFAKIYAENGFDSSEKAIGITLYLIARTVVAFANVCKKIETKIPICIAFHDQDPIMRVVEM